MKSKINLKAEIVIITGSRSWLSKSTIKYWLLKFKNIKLVIHGACRGADLLAEEVCKELQIPYLGIPAEWHKYKKSAGPIRNRQEYEWALTIINGFYNDGQIGAGNIYTVQVMAFHTGIKHSKGTKNMSDQAKRYCLSVYLVDKYID